MGQGKSTPRTYGKQDYGYLHKRLEAIKSPFEVVDPLIPNGLFPPEVLELILMHLDPPSLAKVIISCKLWLQTSVRVFQHAYQHRYVLPPNVDLSTFNAREEVFKQHLIEQQMAKGDCWMQVLSQEYDSGRSRTSFQYKWSQHGNLIALTKEKVHHSSYGSSTSLDKTVVIDLGAGGVEKETYYGVQLINGVRVVPKSTQFADWQWDEVYCNVNDEIPLKDAIRITRKNKFVRADLDDPWHTLRAPARMMTGFPNLDGSAQLLIYDRNTAVRRGCDKFIIEVWNVTNGELIHEIILDCVGDVVIGFYKHYAIMSVSESDETIFVSLTSGLVEKSFPHQSTQYSFCLFDDKIAFITESEVFVYDLNDPNAKLLKSIGMKIFKTTQKFKFTGVSMDKWKLVVSARLLEAHRSYHSNSGGFIAIFEMTKDFTLLCTKYVPSFNKDEVKIACLPNGSIVVGDTALIVFDFLHHYLEKPMSVVVFTGSPTVQVTKLNPLDLTKFARETLKCELGDLAAISYYEIPAAEAPRAQTNHYTWNESYEHLKNKSNRITFIGAHSRTSYYGQNKADGAAKIITPTFLKYWRKHTDTVAPFTFSSDNLNEKPCQIITRRLDEGFRGASIMVFEKFNEQTQCWEITEPTAPKGIDIEM